MALVRVYCGLASAETAVESHSGSDIWLTVAVVDDAGRLLDICEISNDAGGYAELSALLAQRSGGQSAVAVAAHSDDHVVTQLLTAAGRYIAYTDDDSADDYAERFADDESAEEIQSNGAERRAVGLARALQAGVLSAVAQSPPRDMIALKPVLAAHAAVVAGRQGTAATLREVLRELYPAALRAYPDPAEAIPLAVLDALPEPGILGGSAANRGRDAQVIADLAASEVADTGTLTEAITALRVAIAETPRRTGVTRALTAAVAETIRQSVAAVRASDAAAAALVSVLADRMSGTSAAMARAAARHRPTAPVSTAPAPNLRPVPESARAPEPARMPDVARATGGRRRAQPQPTAAPAPAAAVTSAPPVTSTPPVSPQPTMPPPMMPSPLAPLAPVAAAYVPPTNAPPVPITPAAAPPLPTRRMPAPPAPVAPLPVAPAAMAPPPVAPVPVVPPMAPTGFPTGGYPMLAPRSPAPYRQAPAAHQYPEPAGRKPEPSIGSVMPPPPGIAPLFPTREPVARPQVQSTYPLGNGFGYDPLASVAPVTAPPAPMSPAQPYRDPMIDTGGLAKIMAGLTAPSLDPETPPPGSRSSWPLSGDPTGDLAYETKAYDAKGYGANPFGNDPLGDDPFGASIRGGSGDPPSNGLDVPRQRDARVTPPWQADDLPAEPPGLRLVEPAPLTDPALSDDRVFVDELSGEFRFEPPALRLVDSDRDAGRPLQRGNDRSFDRGGDRANGNGRLPMRGQRAERPVEAAAQEESDGDLLIFAAARSAWFTDHIDSDDATWGGASDAGWRAAEQASRPVISAETSSGLPRRVPQENLVPGSPMTSPDRPLHIVRDAAAIAAHTTGYFRGWRRGQEAGGYRVGGRPGREPAAGWDFSRDNGNGEREYAPEREYEFEYRSARR